LGQNCDHGFYLARRCTRSPTTRLAVMTAIMLCIIFVGVLTRTALAFGLAQLRKAMAREGR
jgi:hypothetical protein